MEPQELAGRLSVITREHSPFFGMMTYKSRRTEKREPLKVKLHMRPSNSEFPRWKYTFAAHIDRFCVPVDHEHRFDLN